MKFGVEMAEFKRILEGINVLLLNPFMDHRAVVETFQGNGSSTPPHRFHLWLFIFNPFRIGLSTSYNIVQRIPLDRLEPCSFNHLDKLIR